MHMRRDAGGLQFLHRAHHVERVAVAVIGIDQQRQLAGAVDAIRLCGELGQRQHDQVGRAQHGERRDRAGEHADLEPQLLGDSCRYRIEDRSRMNAVRACDHGTETLPPIGPMHVCPPLVQLHAELLIHRQKVEVVPGLGDLAVLDPRDAHAGEARRLVGGSGRHSRAGMRARDRQAHGDPVAVDQRILDGDAHVRKRLAVVAEERLESGRPLDLLAVGTNQAVPDVIVGHHLVDGTLASLVPDLLEPAVQNGLTLCHRAASLTPPPQIRRAARRSRRSSRRWPDRL